MAYSADEERSLTGSLFTKRPRGYGTAVTSSFHFGQEKPKKFLLHNLCSNDTLQSLAVKYDSTVADIKKANRLWNNESLALRDNIVVPVFSDSIFNTETRIDIKSTASTPAKSSRSTASDESSVEQSNTNGKITGIDFFAKYDSSIGSIKKKVEKQVENAASYLDDEEDILFTSRHIPTRTSSSSSLDSRDQRSRDSSTSIHLPNDSNDLHSTPEPVVKSKLKKKLDNFEKHQDEDLFQL